MGLYTRSEIWQDLDESRNAERMKAILPAPAAWHALRGSSTNNDSYEAGSLVNLVVARRLSLALAGVQVTNTGIWYAVESCQG